MVLLIPHLTGCFHYVPVGSSAVPSGTEVMVGVTDRGRVELTPVVGHGVRNIGGPLLESTDSSLVLSVTSVQYIDTRDLAAWPGERMELRREFVTDVRERRISRSRTGILAALIAAGIVAASLIAIWGFGDDPGDNRPNPDPPGQQ